MTFTYRTIKGSELTWAELDENFRLVDQYHDESASSAAIASAAANFKGNWSALTGALAVPASVYHNGSYWMLLSNLANVTADVPGVSAAWAAINRGDVQGSASSVDGNGVVFNGTTGKILKSLGAAPVKKTGDTMTGALNLPSNGLAVGTNQLVVSGGNVGVGKTPSVALDVLGGLRLSAAAAVAGAYQQLDFRAGIYTKCAIRGYSVSTIDAGELRFMTAPDSDVVKDRLVITSTGNVLSVSGTIGYGAGAGGVVTQSTSKSTAVSLNKPCGRITTHNQALASGASVNFTLNNSNISDLDTLQVNAATSSNYLIQCVNCSGGSALIRITNISGASQSEAIPINFNVLKGASS